MRYSHHDLTKLGALASQVAVSDAGSGALELSSQPGTRWIQVEPLVFRDEEGTSTIAFREGRRGRITHLFLGEVPVFAFERVPWYESLEVHGAIAGAAIVLFAATVVIGPAGALLRRRLRAPAPKPQARLPMAARAALWLGALVFVVFYIGLASYVSSIRSGSSSGSSPGCAGCSCCRSWVRCWPRCRCCARCGSGASGAAARWRASPTRWW